MILRLVKFMFGRRLGDPEKMRHEIVFVIKFEIYDDVLIISPAL